MSEKARVEQALLQYETEAALRRSLLAQDMGTLGATCQTLGLSGIGDRPALLQRIITWWSTHKTVANREEAYRAAETTKPRRHLTEVWANGPRWRTVTVHSPEPYTVQYSWGKYERDVEHYIRMFGGLEKGGLKMAMESSHGSGSEKWFEGLDAARARGRVETIREAARRAGFKRLGTF